MRGKKDNTLITTEITLNILLEIGRHANANLTEIARNLHLTKPRTLRVLRTLEQHGFVCCNENKRYKFGNSMLVLGTAAWNQVDLVRLASVHLEELGAKTNETVQLKIRDHNQALCIDKFEPSRDLRVHALVGRRRPLFAGSGKVILAYLPESLWDSVIPEEIPQFTGHTIANRETLLNSLLEIRNLGYCISYGEIGEQLISVSVPVFSHTGDVLASVNVVAPEFRTGNADIQRFIALLKKTSGKISEQFIKREN